MCAFVVLGLVLFHTKLKIGLGKRLRNNLFCAEWDAKKTQFSQSVSTMILLAGDVQVKER